MSGQYQNDENSFSVLQFTNPSVSDITWKSWTNELNYEFFETPLSVDSSLLSGFRAEPTSSTSEVDENAINEMRMTFLRRVVTPKFLASLRDEDYQFGIKSETEELVRSQLKINRIATLNWLSEMYIRNFSNEFILAGVFRLLERFKSDEVSPQGEVMALAAISHQNPEIQELGVRAFENWVSYESLKVLRSVKPTTKWLEDYIGEVITDLEKQLCLS